MSLKSGQRVAWFDQQSKTYHYGNTLPNGIELTDNGMYVYINDKVSGFVTKVPYDSLDLYTHKNRDHIGDYMSMNKWIKCVTQGYITDYDGSAYLTDGEYHYTIGHPFEIYTKSNAEPYKHFKGVIFFGK